jgi:hypothetical protein
MKAFVRLENEHISMYNPVQNIYFWRPATSRDLSESERKFVYRTERLTYEYRKKYIAVK